MRHAFPIIVVAMFMGACLVEICQANWPKAWFYFFSGAINFVAIFM